MIPRRSPRPVSRLLQLALALLLCGALPACTMKYNYNRVDDSWFDRELNRGWTPPMEFGFALPNMALGGSGVALAAEWSLQSMSRETVAPLAEFDFVRLSALSLSGRFIPMDRGAVRPYVGGGFGRSTLKTHWKGPNYNRALYYCYGACTGSFEETLLTSWHPFYLAGFEIYGEGNSTLLFEYRRQVNRSDSFYDLSGHTFSAGIRWMVPPN